MNAPNFAALAADIAAQQDMEAYRRRRREKWLARPLNEREEVIRCELTNALRTDMRSEFKTEDAVDWVRDHFADADGARDLRELLNAVAEEDSGRAWDVLKRVLGVVAKVEHEWES